MKSFKNLTAAWLALALILRAGLAVKLGERSHQTDEAGYFVISTTLAERGILGTGDIREITPPVPNGFFALFFFLFGPHKVAARLGQAAVGVLTAWMISKMTADLTGSERAGRWSLALCAVYPFFVYYSAILMTESLYVFWTVAGLWSLCRSLREQGENPWRAARAGLAFSLAALCRAEAAPIAAVIWAICFFTNWRKKAWALAVACWLAPLLLWCARSQALSGHFLLDAHGGMTLLHGTMLLDHNERDTAAAQKAVEGMEFYQKAQALDPVARDRVYMKEAFAYMRADPVRMLGQWARKFVNFWRFYPRPEKRFIETGYSHPGAGLSKSALIVISLLFEPALIALGLAGLWSLRSRWRELFPLGLFLLGTMGIHMISVSQMRYRLPVMPILILGTCYCISARFLRASGPFAPASKARGRSGT